MAELTSIPSHSLPPCRPAAFTPSSFNFVGPSPGGPGTGTQQQAGSVSPGGTQAASNVAGTGQPACCACSVQLPVKGVMHPLLLLHLLLLLLRTHSSW